MSSAPFIAALIGTAFAAGAIAKAQEQKPPVAFAGDPRMGTCTHFAQGWDVEKTMPLIEMSGFGWIRDDLGWEGVEKERGEYDVPPNTRKWIKAAHAHHIRLLLILNGHNRLYADPYDPVAFAKWGAWIATTLKDDVDALEILNEPNNFGFSKVYGGQHEGEGNSPWVGKYVTLMNMTADAIKKANPSMPVVGFGAGAPVTYKQLALGPSPAIDALADHPYSNQSTPELVPTNAKTEMQKFGASFTDDRGSFASLIEGFGRESAKRNGPKQIWLTEWGFSTYVPLMASQFGGYTEAAQADYILRRYVECFGLGVNVSFLYDFRDNGNPNEVEDCWGIVHQDGQPKASAQAVAHLAALFHDLRRPNEAEVGEVHVFPAATWPEAAPIAVYRFIDSEQHPAVAIWATDRAGGDRQPRVGDVELNWGPGVTDLTAVDVLTGQSGHVKFTSSGGRSIKQAMVIPNHPLLLRASEKAMPAVAGGPAKSVDLGLFNGNINWSFNKGQEFPGAAGSFAVKQEGDKSAGVLHFDFTHGGAYVAAQTKLNLADDVSEIRIDAASALSLRVSIRLVDSGDQCHQYVKQCAGAGSWETLRLPLNEKASEHWGGANDGRIRFPIKELSLCVGKPGGDAVVDDIKFAAFTVLKK